MVVVVVVLISPVQSAFDSVLVSTSSGGSYLAVRLYILHYAHQLETNWLLGDGGG